MLRLIIAKGFLRKFEVGSRKTGEVGSCWEIIRNRSGGKRTVPCSIRSINQLRLNAIIAFKMFKFVL